MIETSGSNGSHDEEKLSHLLEHLLENGTIVDGTMATSPSHQQQMWPLRERIAEALLRDGYCYKYDISLPFNAFYQWTSENKGSISAEHGLGFKKRNFMHFSKCPTAINSMHQIKQVFDPHMIMNPYKVLPGGSI